GTAPSRSPLVGPSCGAVMLTSNGPPGIDNRLTPSLAPYGPAVSPESGAAGDGQQQDGVLVRRQRVLTVRDGEKRADGSEQRFRAAVQGRRADENLDGGLARVGVRREATPARQR